MSLELLEDDILKIKMKRIKREFSAFLVKKFAVKVDNPDKIAHACCYECEQEYKLAIVRFTPSCPKCGESNSLSY